MRKPNLNLVVEEQDRFHMRHPFYLIGYPAKHPTTTEEMFAFGFINTKLDGATYLGIDFPYHVITVGLDSILMYSIMS